MALLDFVIRFVGDTRQFNAATKQVVGGLNRIGNEAKSGVLAAFNRNFGMFLGGAAFVGFAQKTMAMADQLDELSKRSKLSTDFLQELDYITRHEGGSMQDFVIANKMLNTAMARAAKTGNEQSKAIQTLGLSYEALREATPEERFKMISDQMQGATLSLEKLEAARLLLGRGFDRMLPAMQAGLRRMGEEARKAGQVMEKSIVEQLANAHDAIEDATKAVTIGLAPAFVTLAKTIDRMVLGWRMIALHFDSKRLRPGNVVRGEQQIADEVMRRQKEFEDRWSLKPAGTESGVSTGASPGASRSLGQSAAASANMAGYESSRIGLFVGGAFNPFHETALRQEAKLSAMDQKLAEIQNNTARTADSMD